MIDHPNAPFPEDYLGDSHPYQSNEPTANERQPVCTGVVLISPHVNLPLGLLTVAIGSTRDTQITDLLRIQA